MFQGNLFDPICFELALVMMRANVLSNSQP